MKTSVILALLFSLTALASAPAAFADEEDNWFVEESTLTGRWYVAGSYGYLFDYQRDSNSAGGGGNFVFDFDDGDNYHGAVGTYWGNFRSEFEVGYWDSDLDNIAPSAGTNDAGSVQHVSFMINTYMDFLLTPSHNLEGYVGLGVGGTYIDADINFDPDFTFIDATTVSELDDQEFVFTYQFLAGVVYHVSTNVALTGGYRHRILTETDFDNNIFWRDSGQDSVDFGLRITF